MFCWVLLPICYYLGVRDGCKRGFQRGLPMGALAWVITTLQKDVEEKVKDQQVTKAIRRELLKSSTPFSTGEKDDES